MESPGNFSRATLRGANPGEKLRPHANRGEANPGRVQQFPKAEVMGGWPGSPDIAHNACVEAAAIKHVRQSLDPPVADRQRDTADGI